MWLRQFRQVIIYFRATFTVNNYLVLLLCILCSLQFIHLSLLAFLFPRADSLYRDNTDAHKSFYCSALAVFTSLTTQLTWCRTVKRKNQLLSVYQIGEKIVYKYLLPSYSSCLFAFEESYFILSTSSRSVYCIYNNSLYPLFSLSLFYSTCVSCTSFTHVSTFSLFFFLFFSSSCPPSSLTQMHTCSLPPCLQRGRFDVTCWKSLSQEARKTSVKDALLKEPNGTCVTFNASMIPCHMDMIAWISWKMKSISSDSIQVPKNGSQLDAVTWMNSNSASRKLLNLTAMKTVNNLWIGVLTLTSLMSLIWPAVKIYSGHLRSVILLSLTFKCPLISLNHRHTLYSCLSTSCYSSLVTLVSLNSGMILLNHNLFI